LEPADRSRSRARSSRPIPNGNLVLHEVWCTARKRVSAHGRTRSAECFRTFRLLQMSDPEAAKYIEAPLSRVRWPGASHASYLSACWTAGVGRRLKYERAILFFDSRRNLSAFSQGGYTDLFPFLQLSF